MTTKRRFLFMCALALAGLIGLANACSAASEQAGEGGCPGHDCSWFQGPCQAATARLAEMSL